MARIATFAAVIITGLLGNYVYRQSTYAESQPKFDHISIIKCVTKNGETYYGDVLPNAECSRSAVVEIPARLENAEKAQVPNMEVLRFSCDGREYCSQMTSCDEARFFLENCPNVKMDGDNDGIPCESQWCG